MPRAFSIARALDLKGNLVVGWLSYADAIDPFDSVESTVDIDTDTLTFNTGYEDADGRMIFTGDRIKLGDFTTIATVCFDDDEGYFAIYPSCYESAPDRTLQLFPREYARKCRIVGNIYEEGDPNGKGV